MALRSDLAARVLLCSTWNIPEASLLQSSTGLKATNFPPFFQVTSQFNIRLNNRCGQLNRTCAPEYLGACPLAYDSHWPNFMTDKVSPSLILRERDPDNLEYDFHALHGQLTPNESFFVRSHFPQPHIENNDWRLNIQGAVKHPLELTLRDLQSFPAITHAATIECSGNGRVFLTPKASGVQWALGAVGCAEWTGASLSAVLARAEIQANAAEILFEGADVGTPEKASRPKEKIRYARSLPIDQAQRNDVLLAWQMNGEPIPAAHGAPVRLIVPGWYGMAWVKWLTRIHVSDRPLHGYFETVEYARWKQSEGMPPERVPITELAVKSSIARPAMHERVPLGQPYRVHGAAWSANDPIVQVEVSTDDGKSWAIASMPKERQNHGWQLWQYEWTPKATGAHILRARATDSAGRTQPAEHDQNNESYIVHHTLPVTVEVTAYAVS
jgi:DMSO/TMAO reductase YedYZ molybdopterin-dependent catalytic subunit